jgi:hypothetical protein
MPGSPTVSGYFAPVNKNLGLEPTHLLYDRRDGEPGDNPTFHVKY